MTDIPTLLDTARHWHLAVLTDTATIERPAGTELDEHGTETTRWQHVGSTPVLVQQATGTANPLVDSAGQPVRVVDWVAKVPMATDLRDSDRLTVTTTTDPALAGPWLVTEVESQSWSIVRRAHLVSACHSPLTHPSSAH